MSFASCVDSAEVKSAAVLLDSVFQNYSGPPFAIGFWDGTKWCSTGTGAGFTICLRTKDAWQTLSASVDEVALATRYIEGDIDVEGSLYLALRALPFIESAIENSSTSSAASVSTYIGLMSRRLTRLFHWGRLHSRSRDAACISQHYDKPASFYELFLGPTMVYSCAYFRSPDDTLTQAQRNKMELICRKLDLHAGERFLDIGCGWGSLVLHAREGFQVLSHGVSLSQVQVDYAKQRILARNQAGDCEVAWSDYRDLADVHMPFHKIASVGMCEHVGKKNIAEYFREAYKLLLPGGLFLNHGITRNSGSPHNEASFINEYVFPDGELLTVTEMVQAAEEAGFEVRDVQDLREHYEETLHRWVAGLERHKDEAIALTDTRTYRTWQLYMAGCAEAFRRDDIAVHQLLLSKNRNGASSASTTREGW